MLIASIHDVSPHFESEVDRLIDLMTPRVGQRLALLVVPDHWGRTAIVPGSPFATRLRGWADAGMEIFLHGYFHRDESAHRALGARLQSRWMTAGEGEFLGLDRDTAAERIRRGRTLIEGVIGSSVAGFIAPAWLYGPGALQALSDCAIPLAEDHWRVWSPLRNQVLAKGPVITWASRTRLRTFSSLAAAAVLRHAPINPLRIGVHPGDCYSSAIKRSIDATFRIALRTRSPAGYSDLLRAA